MLSRLQSRAVVAPFMAARTAMMSSSVVRAPAHQQTAARAQTAARVPVRSFTSSSVRLQDSSASSAPGAPAADAPVRAASIVLTAAGPDRPGIVHEVSSVLNRGGANVEESRMTILGNDFAIILRVTVPESQTADKVAELVRGAFPEFVVSARATTTHPIFTSPVRIFSVAVEGPDQPGIVQILTKMFLDHKGSVRDLDTDTSSAPFAGYKIFSLKSVVALPINADFQKFEESLHKFEDEYGFDVDVNEGMNETAEDEQQNEEDEEEPEQDEDEEEDPRRGGGGRMAGPGPAGRGLPPPPGMGAQPRRPPSIPPPQMPRMPDMGMPRPAPRGPVPPPAGARPAPRGPAPTGPSRGPAPTGPSRGPVRK